MTVVADESVELLAPDARVFGLLLKQLDKSVSKMMDLEQNGKYVPLASAMDIFLDFRNELSEAQQKYG